MEDNCDSGVVPSLNFVVEHIYSSCDLEKNDSVSVSTLVDFVRPLMHNHPNGITELLFFLDPNDENPSVSRSTFYEAMKKWTASVNGTDNSLSHISFRESDISDEKELPFHQSTPKPSLEPSSTQNITNLLNCSNFSTTSFSNYNKSGSTVGCEKLMLEEKVKELEHKYLNAVNELSLVKSQLTASEEQYADLKEDLDRTNRRLLLEQQVNADLQKTMEHNDDYKEEIIITKKENECLQKMLASAKKESSDLVALIRDLEFEKEHFERRMGEIRKNDHQKKQKLTDLQTALSLSEEENKSLKKFRNELEDKVDEQMSLLKHFTEMSEYMKNENQTLRTMVKKTGLVDLSDPSNLKDLPNLSSHGTPIISPNSPTPKSSTPFKNMYHPTIFKREIYNSPNFIRQIISPVSPHGLDTPNVHLVKMPMSVNNSSELFVTSHGVKHSPKRDQGIESLHFDCPQKSTSSNSLRDYANEECQNVAKKTDTPSPTLSSGNALCETFEDLDLSAVSEKLSSKGQDLLSELQACKLLDNSDECFVADHAELSKIVKEHANCSKIIGEYQQRIEVLMKDVEFIETKHKNLLIDHNNVEQHSKCIEELLNKEKTINEHLDREILNLTKQVANLIDAENQKAEKLHKLKYENKEFKQEIEKLKNKEQSTHSQHITLHKKFDTLINEKMTLATQLEQKKNENKLLFDENSQLYTKIKTLSNTLNSKDKEVQELLNVRIKNEQLKKKIKIMEEEHVEKCREMDNLTNKIEQSKNMGKHFVQILKSKLLNETNRMELLNESSTKLKQLVDELKTKLDHLKAELYLIKSSSEETSFSGKPVSEENIEDESTSTEGSETNTYSERRQLKKKQNIRRSNYEKQQLKIIKLEEQVEVLQNELFNEKVKTQKLRDLEFKNHNLELEYNNIEQDKNEIARELDAIKCDLSLKDVMMKQLEESHLTYKLEVDNLNEKFEKEKEAISINLQEIQQKARKNEIDLKKQITDLEKEVISTKEEKQLLENILDKQETKIITLKKTLSDISRSSEEAKVFENIVIEKESMLQFNRELLAKSNNSLQSAENCIYSLKLLLDQCKMVLLETADDLFRATKEVFETWKNNLQVLPVDPDLLNAMHSFENDVNGAVSDFTEEKVNKINTKLILCAKFLKALAPKSGAICLLCRNNVTSIKGVNKFTLRPSKLEFRRMPSSDPDISSSCMKEGESPLPTKEDAELNIEKEENNALVESKISLKPNDSLTDWLGNPTNSLSVQMKNESPHSTLRSRNVSTETENSDRSFHHVSSGDVDIPGVKQSIVMLEVPRRRSHARMLYEKCTTFGMMMVSIICFFAMFLIYFHLECVRHGNGSIECPLDFLVSVRRVQSEFHNN